MLGWQVADDKTRCEGETKGSSTVGRVPNAGAGAGAVNLPV